MTQNETILQYMRTHEGISTYKAFEMRITRLAARIAELRNDGYSIVSEKRQSKGISGDEKPKTYVLYRLEEKS